MTFTPNDGLRRKWCAALAKLVSPSFPDDAARALTDMLPALRHLPDHLFTERTLIEAAERKFAPKGGRQATPAFDEILAALNHYRRTYLPDPTLRLAAPACDPETREAPCPEEVAIVRELVEGWQREVAERHTAQAELERDRRPLHDVSASGQALGDIRRARFAWMMSHPNFRLKSENIPEAYRP